MSKSSDGCFGCKCGRGFYGQAYSHKRDKFQGTNATDLLSQKKYYLIRDFNLNIFN